MRPFSCGTQYGDWTAANCLRCKKSFDSGVSEESCDLEEALFIAYIGDGEIDEQIAGRLQPEKNRYCWQCGEWEPKEEWKREWREKHGTNNDLQTP